ncbi:MAG TPA: hypothetical protein VNM89_03910 [Solirubrobacterales bacterium]|nr:hypothetical protein [Solirubrobacterales bacterium]
MLLPRSIQKIPLAILAIGLLFALAPSAALAAPTATTGTATKVAGTFATLNATVAADSGHTTRYSIGYGTSSNVSDFNDETANGTTTSSSPISVSGGITGLRPETTYYFAVGAYDTVTNQMTMGRVQSFTTTAFYATTETATEVGSTTATLNATVSADSRHTTRYSIGYGTSSNVSDFNDETANGTTTSSSPMAVSGSITGLRAETTYYFAVGAYDTVTNQMTVGRVRSFTTTANDGVKFRAAEYPATVSGSFGSQPVFSAAGGNFNVNCSTKTLSGSLAGASSTLDLTPTLQSCTDANFGQITVSMNSCSYEIDSNGSWLGPYTGHLTIVCDRAGDVIEYAASTGCIVKVPAQSTSFVLTYTNTGPFNARVISVGGSAISIDWTTRYSYICGLGGIPSSGTDGVIDFSSSGGATLGATNSTGAYNELYVAG